MKKWINIVIFTLICFIINSQNLLDIPKLDSLNINWYYDKNMAPYSFENGIIITPPPYFLPFKYTNKQGFINPKFLSSIEVEKINNIAETILAKKIKEKLEEQNSFLINVEKNFTNSDKSCLIYEMIYNAMTSEGHNIDFHQIILVTGDYNTSIIGIAVFPEMYYKLMHNVMRESLLSIDCEN